mmetsp:Transcript_5782/g.19262  ORF Transcript_5782/g.19262 Transcript_5782/m.19262 type:complete len:377 (+) Transcript_5782:89-1219(+)
MVVARLLALLLPLARAEEIYLARIPNGKPLADAVHAELGYSRDSVGHAKSGRGGVGNQNKFAEDFAREVYADRTWTRWLCERDSDGDNRTNGLELGDPCCVWKQGDPDPEVDDLSLPGHADHATSRTMPTCAPPSAAPPWPPRPPVDEPPLGRRERLILGHAVLMAVAWALLLPTGAVASVSWRRALGGGRRWLKAHIAAQVCGLAASLAGLAVGVYVVGDRGLATHFRPNEWEGGFAGSHRGLGLALCVLLALQPVAGLLRPAAPLAGERRSGARRAWEAAHKAGGYCLLALGAVQAVSGHALLADWVDDAGDLRFGGLPGLRTADHTLLLYFALLSAPLILLPAGLVLSARVAAVAPPDKSAQPEPSQPAGQRM